MIQLLLRFKASPLLTAKDGFTALHFAAQRESGSLSCAYLIAKSAKLLHMKVSKGKKTALHLAISKGNTEVVQKLLDLGADPTTRSGCGKTCLELCQASNKDMRDILIEALKKRKGTTDDKIEVDTPHDSEIASRNEHAQQPSRSLSQPDHQSSSLLINPTSDDSNGSQTSGELIGVEHASSFDSSKEQQERLHPCHHESSDIKNETTKKRKIISSHLLDDED